MIIPRNCPNLLLWSWLSPGITLSCSSAVDYPLELPLYTLLGWLTSGITLIYCAAADYPLGFGFPKMGILSDKPLLLLLLLLKVHISFCLYWLTIIRLTTLIRGSWFSKPFFPFFSWVYIGIFHNFNLFHQDYMPTDFPPYPSVYLLLIFLLNSLFYFYLNSSPRLLRRRHFCNLIVLYA